MKFLVVLSLIAALASADFVMPNLVDTAALAEVQEIIAAINSPSTDPATAAALEQLLLETFGVSAQPSPVVIGPAIVEQPSPVFVGPALVEFPAPDGGAVTAESPAIVPAPAATPAADAADAASPLVQIILNINQASSDAAAVAPAPVEAAVVPGSPAIVPSPAVVPGRPTILPSPAVVPGSPAVVPGRPTILPSPAVVPGRPAIY